MKPNVLFALVLTLWLASCATVPSDPRPAVKPPQMPPLPPAAPVPDFISRMQLFLSGKLPPPHNSDESATSAVPSTSPSNKP